MATPFAFDEMSFYDDLPSSDSFSVYGAPSPTSDMSIYEATPSSEDFAAMGLTPEQFADIQKSVANMDLSNIGLTGGLGLIGGYGPPGLDESKYMVKAPLSNKGNPTSTLSKSTNDFFVYDNQPVRLVDKATNQIVFEGKGPEDARKASELAAQLTEQGGRKASWDIQTGPGLDLSMYGAGQSEGWKTVANEKENKSTLGKIGSVLGTALPIAMIPLTMGASAPLAGLGAAGNVALGAGVGAASAGLRGQDILKGAVMGGLTSAGGQFLSGPLKGVGLGTDVARAVGTGIGATAGGLATGQNLQNALLGGVAAGGTTYLGGKLFPQDNVGKMWNEYFGAEGVPVLPDMIADGPLALVEGFNPINFKAPTSLASTATPSSDIVVTGTGARPSFTSATPSFAVNVPGVTDLSEPEIKVTAQREAPPVEQPAFAVNIPADIADIAGPSAEEDIEITAQKQAPVAEEPSFAVNVPTPTEAVGGPDLEEDIEIMARDEGLAQAEQPSFAVNTLGPLPPEIIATAQKEAALTQEEPSLAVLPPATTTGPDTLVTGQREVPQVEQEPSFAVNVPTATPEIIATGQRETPAVKEEPSFAALPPATTTGPDTLVTGQRETPLTEETAAPVVLPPATTTGPDTLVTGQRETPVVEEKPAFAVMPPATTTGPDTLVTGQRETPLVEEKPTFAVMPPATTTGPDTLVTGQRETPVVEEKPAFAVMPPATTTGPDTLVTGQRETPLTEETAAPVVLPPATTTGPDTLVTGQRETPVVKEEPSFAALPPATTTGPDTVVTGKREDVKLDDKEGVGGPYIPPKSEIVVTGDKGTPKFDDKGEYTGPLVNIPSLVDDAVQEELAGKKTEPKKKLDVADYLKLAGLAVGLGAKLFDGNGSTGSAGRYSSTGRLSPAFTDKLPTPGQGGAFTVGGLGGTAADRTFAARPVTDWYRYGMGPAMDIPTGTDLSRATSPYAGYGPGTLGEETFKAVSGMAHGGSMGYSRGSSRESFAVQGPGTGRSDDIPAVLSDGEYVIDAETVALLGDGSSKAGAKKLDEMRVKVRKHKGKNLAKGKFSVNARRPEAYMSGGRI